MRIDEITDDSIRSMKAEMVIAFDHFFEQEIKKFFLALQQKIGKGWFLTKLINNLTVNRSFQKFLRTTTSKFISDYFADYPAPLVKSLKYNAIDNYGGMYNSFSNMLYIVVPDEFKEKTLEDFIKKFSLNTTIVLHFVTIITHEIIHYIQTNSREYSPFQMIRSRNLVEIDAYSYTHAYSFLKAAEWDITLAKRLLNRLAPEMAKEEYFNKNQIERAMIDLSVKRANMIYQNSTVDESVGRVVTGVNTTGDVGENEITKQAAKWGWVVDADGLPPIISKEINYKKPKGRKYGKPKYKQPSQRAK